MSLERTITEIKNILEQDIFQPASSDELEKRKKQSWSSMSKEEKFSELVAETSIQIVKAIELLKTKYPFSSSEERKEAFKDAVRYSLNNFHF